MESGNPLAEPGAIRPFVICTAGHVDHGKSTLVKALTGIDPDRLAEEKARAMTIDLGFAWLTLPSGRPLSIVDVPGHERFIKNMLAGVGGTDAALLVVAADDGPMPQTDEHLAILDLLGIEHSVVALSKCDLVDGDWLALVQEEIRERLASTTLANAPIIPVSAITGDGLPELIDAVDAVLAAVPPAAGRNSPRLPVDRVFSVAGFGTIVTGALSGGELAIGDELRIFPHGRTARVRGMQSHQTTVVRALPGSRTAVNLSGITTAEIQRGDVLAPRGAMSPTQRLDVRLRLLPSAPLALKQNDEVDFFVGAAELPARLTLLDRERLEPGETAWVQLRFRSPVAVQKHDRFIIRRASPSDTLGGGEIVDPNPPRHKRFRPETLAALETLAAGGADEIVLQQLDRHPFEVRELRSNTAGLSAEQVDEALNQLVAEGDVMVLGASPRNLEPGRFAVASTLWHTLSQQLAHMIDDHHEAHPLRPGIPREEARRRLQLTPPRLFDAFIITAVDQGIVADDGATLRLPDFRLTLDTLRRARADAYLQAIRATPFMPPGPHDLPLDEATMAVLERNGEVVNVDDGIYFAPEAWSEIVAQTLRYIDDHGSITLAQFRDYFGTSRKYAQAALERLDRLKYTRRVGDDRVRGSRRPDTDKEQ